MGRNIIKFGKAMESARHCMAAVAILACLYILLLMAMRGRYMYVNKSVKRGFVANDYVANKR